MGDVSCLLFGVSIVILLPVGGGEGVVVRLPNPLQLVLVET